MMYTTSSAARIRYGSVFSDAWKACAVPWKVPEIASGMWIDAVDLLDGADRIAERDARAPD